MNIFLPWLGVVEFIYKIFAPKFQFPFFKNNVYLGFFCLVFSSHSRIVHLYGDVINICEGMQIFIYDFSSFGHWAVRVLKRATPTVTRDICL